MITLLFLTFSYSFFVEIYWLCRYYRIENKTVSYYSLMLENLILGLSAHFDWLEKLMQVLVKFFLRLTNECSLIKEGSGRSCMHIFLIIMVNEDVWRQTKLNWTPRPIFSGSSEPIYKGCSNILSARHERQKFVFQYPEIPAYWLCIILFLSIH